MSEIGDAVIAVAAADGWPDTRPAAGVKIAATLSRRAAEALETVVTVTGLTKTEIVNQALIRNAAIEEALSLGGEVKIRATADGDLERVVFL